MLIHLFGGLELLSAAGGPIHPATRKASLLLATLAVLEEKGARREMLCELFWPDRDETQARGSLRQALAAIRQVAAEMDGGSMRIDGDSETVRLIADASKVDIQLFGRLIRRQDAETLATAAALYQGDLLATIAVPEPLDQWFAPHKRALRNKALVLCEQLSQLATNDQGQAVQASQSLAERLLAADPTAEEAHRALIRLYQLQGRTNAALQQFELCKEALHRHLGVQPEAQTRELVTSPSQAGRSGTFSSPADTAPLVSARRRNKEQPSVVVMPFDNLSGEGDEYLVEGIVEEITAALSRVREFFVIARQSAFAYKGRSVDVREIGRELGVNYVVEGTVRRGGDRLRISVQLVDAETRTQLWSERYDRAGTHLFTLQDEIAAHVAGAIHPALLSAEIAAAKLKPPGSLRAYELVLQAYPKVWSATAEDNRQAMALLMQAIAIDPDYGRAHALLAWCHSQDVVYLWSANPEQDRISALISVDAAARLAVNDPMALTALGAAISQCIGDQDRAAAYMERALALDPNNAWAWARSGWIGIYRDQPETARQCLERALALSPFDPLEFNFRVGIAVTHALQGEYALAAKLTQRMLDRNPQVTWAYRQLASFSALAGDLTTARYAIAKLQEANPGVSIAVMKTHHPARHIPRLFDLFLEGWRLAGLPEE